MSKEAVERYSRPQDMTPSEETRSTQRLGRKTSKACPFQGQTAKPKEVESKLVEMSK